VGHRALKADLNGEIVPMATTLKSGDTVRIITSDLSKGPDRSWLPFAKTNTAKSKISDYFRKTSRENKIFLGKSLLQKELDRAGLGLFKNIPYRKIRNYLGKSKKYEDIDDFLVAIGEGSLRPLDFVSELYPQQSATLGAIKWLEIPILSRHEQAFTPVSIKIVSKDAVEQLDKILRVVGSLHINVLKTKAYLSVWTGDFILRQTLAIRDFALVSKLFENLEQLDGVKKIERLFWQRKLLFIAGVSVAFGLWIVHPLVLHYLVNQVGDSLWATPFLYLGLFLLFINVF
jgi:(p)ppGpp synthase/HD superfamily hydrolase